MTHYGAPIPEAPRPSRPWLGIGLAALVLGGLTTGLVIGLNGTHATSSPSENVATPNPVETEPPVTPVGIVVYPIRHGLRIATLDAAGRAATCFDGSAGLEVFDLARRTIIYSPRGDALYSVALDRCAGKPHLLASFLQLDHRRPTGGEGIRCASVSPDGNQIVLSLIDSGKAGLWIGSILGKGWRFIAGPQACSWLDERHALSESDDYGDRVAIDVVVGRIEFIRDPEVFDGSRSPDGRFVAFNKDGALDVSDRITGVTHWVADGLPLYAQPSDQSLWNPDGSRLLVQTDKGYDIYDILRFDRREVNVDSGSTVGWFSDDQLWSENDDLQLLDPLTGYSNAVELPGWLPNDQSGPPQVIVAGERQGSVSSEPALVPFDRAPADSLTAAGLLFKRPPSWRIGKCTDKDYCDIQGYIARWEFDGGSGPQIEVGTTRDSIGRARFRILYQAGAFDPCSRRRGTCVDYDVERVKLGAITFTRIELYGPDGPTDIFLARIHDRTVFITCDPADPSVHFVLSTLRTA